MGAYDRKKIAEQISMSKRLDYPRKTIAQIMPNGFSDDEFICAFKKYYPLLWNEIETKYQSDYSQYKRRLRKGIMTYKPLPPNQFLLKKCSGRIIATRKSHSEGRIINNHERQKIIEKLERKAQKKLQKKLSNDNYRNRKIQFVTPKYAYRMIQEYFRLRREDNLDIDSRYLILLEVSKFKCAKSIHFLEAVNACEKNDRLRYLAFLALQRFGLYPRLGKKRKGKIKKSQVALKDVEIQENPTELLNRIWENQEKVHKRFDIFLSHSYSNKGELIRLKDQLNKQGYVVYVDWINDVEMLNRKNQNDDTFVVLKERMNQSDALLFVQSERSVGSKYCLEEIEYFKNLKRPMYRLISEDGDYSLPKEVENLKICNQDDDGRIILKRTAK